MEIQIPKYRQTLIDEVAYLQRLKESGVGKVTSKIGAKSLPNKELHDRTKEILQQFFAERISTKDNWEMYV